MLLKRCENCNEVFSAQLTGRMAILCRGCSLDCEEAYLKVLKFLREDETLKITDSEAIAEGAKVPLAFVRVLYKEGRFENKSSQAAETCKRCNAKLNPDEKTFCTGCGRNLTHEVREERQSISTEPEGPVKYYTPQASQKPSRRAEKDTRYGFGRER